MSAQENMSGDQFGQAFGPQPLYHGSMRKRFSDNSITPTAQRGRGAVSTYGNHPDDKAYASASVETAWHYAENSWGSDPHGRRPRVYAVLPKGGIEHDPDPTAFGNKDGHTDDYQSSAGFRVIKQMPFPKSWGDPEDMDR